jgi:hypothetical protein
MARVMIIFNPIIMVNFSLTFLAVLLPKKAGKIKYSSKNVAQTRDL